MTPPGKPLGMSDFFALEAGEYLERLDSLLQQSETPRADEFVRLARALRGSALMANQQATAKAAAGVESLARALREGRRPWDAHTQQLAVRAIDDLKIFVRRAANWSEADSAKAEALAAQLDQLAGRPSAQVRAAEALGLDAGARAFVAREGAAIASALDRAAQALRANPLAHDPLQHVLRALQGLRGLAALSDLPPLPDLLEGIERAIAELTRPGFAPPASVGDLFQGAASAIAKSAREVAERGRPDPEGPEFRSFAALLVQFLESEPDVVPVTSLYYEDAGPHVVKQGVPAARPAGGWRGAGPLPGPPPPGRRPAAATASPPLAAADEAVPETPDLVGSWAVYQRLTRAGVGPASLEEIVARTAPRAPSLDTGRPVDSSIVDIRALLYRGERALQHAQELRAQATHATGDALRALVDEVCDLVALAAEPAPPAPPTPPGP